MLADAVLKLEEDSIEMYSLDALYCVSLAGYAYECILIDSKQEKEYTRGNEVKSLIESTPSGGLLGVHRPRFFEFNAARVFTHDKLNNLRGLSWTHFLS